MATTKTRRSTASKALTVITDALVLLLLAVHYRVYKRGTYWPIKRILESKDEIALRHELKQWLKYKEHEVGYVQVAGAVMFASVTSCLSWNNIDDRHWSGPALWYATIILSLSAIFTGAQQSLVLPDAASVDTMSLEELESMKISFAVSSRQPTKPSACALFSWQIPMMLLGYAVLGFLAGLCSVVLSPLARRVGWNEEAKTVVLFLTISVLCLACWLFPSPFVHRLRSNEMDRKMDGGI